MFKFEPYIKYKVNGKVCKSDDLETKHYSLDLEVSENAVKCVIRPKVKMEMLKFRLDADKKLGKNEVFFANGFQSWTKCYECHADDTIIGLGKIANERAILVLKAGISKSFSRTVHRSLCEENKVFAVCFAAEKNNVSSKLFDLEVKRAVIKYLAERIK